MPRRKKENPRPKGRPQISIDWDKVDHWLMAGLNGIQIAEEIGMHHQTFYDRVQLEKGVVFTVYCNSKKEQGNGRLLTKQYDLALKGNTQLLLKLGEVRLGQKNSIREDVKDIADGVVNAIREIQAESGISIAFGSSMEIKQSILDQGPPRESDQVQDELGPTRAVC